MRYVLITLALCFGLNNMYGQEVYNSTGKPGNKKYKESSHKGFDPSKMIYGGGFGLSFGSYSTYVSVMPMVGYNLTDRFAAGIGLGYSYTWVKDYYPLYNGTTGITSFYDYKANIFYPSLWGRFMFTGDPYNGFFGLAKFEYDFVNYTQYSYEVPSYNVVSSPLKISVPCLLLGLGVRKPISDRGAVAFYFMYDVLQQPYSPYKSNDFLGGLTFGFGVFGGF